MGQAAAVLPSPGLVLGRYRPLRPLGSGGSGSVWLALDERTGLEVALKIVAREGKAAARAEREAEAAARLRHRRCLRAYELAHDSRHVYIAYEYVAGRTWREALRAGELDDAATVEAAAQVLDGLAHAHARGIVHRDVKPSNVLLAEGDGVEVRLLDFGLAQFDEAETLTAAGDVPGTLAYVSPERLHGEEATTASDVWAVGVVLWESLAGRHPFWKASVLESARAIEAGAPTLARLRPDLPKALVAAVDRALALDPARRPSASELADVLRAASERPRKATRRLAVSPGRVHARLGAAALAGGAAGVGAGALPFFPAGFPAVIGLVAAAVALASPRAALAFALAAPLLPFGNLSLGLALAYGALAAVWLVLFLREPHGGLLPALGAALGPAGALALVPAATLAVRSPLRRAAAAGGVVLVAAVSAGLARSPLPLTDEAPPLGLGLAGSEDVDAVAGALLRAAADQRALALAGLVLAAAAALLPLARARGAWASAGWGAAVTAALLVPAPSIPALPVVVAVWAICLPLTLRPWR